MPNKPKFEFQKDPVVYINNVDENEVDRVAKMYEGSSIFITGGTGFLGKVLIEKLLRSCGDLKKIYILTRAKKSKEPGVRIKEMLNNVIFDEVKKIKGEDAVVSKIQPIYGDILLPNLGISEDDLEILSRDVKFVYHCAATIRFDEPLRRAVLINTRGTKYMLDVAAKLKNLELFAYISTAYCHLHVKKLYEKPYDPPADPHKVISACEWLSDEEISVIEKKILNDIPNTYAYTKSLAEALVTEKINELPVLIFRPSIIIPIWREPVSGWTDNINGPTGMLIGAGKGVIRTMYCKSSGYGDFVPVDIAVNGILVSSWRYMTCGPEYKCPVIHLTASNDIKVSWAEIIELGRWVVENKVPLNGVAWYPGGSMKSNYYVHWICMMLFHWLPAILVDIILRILGYPPVLMKVQNRITKGFQIFEYYANNVWQFDIEQTVRTRKLMNKKERITYIVERIEVDIIEYFTNCVMCARRYILKETDDTIPAARRHMKIMWYVDKLCKFVWLLGISYVIYSYFLSDYFTTTAIVKPLDSL